jgi:hypothetical protein
VVVPFDSQLDVAVPDYARTPDGRFIPIDDELQRRADERRKRPGVKPARLDRITMTKAERRGR